MGIGVMEDFMHMLDFFTQSYKNENQYIRAKAELTAAMLVMILLSVILELFASFFVSKDAVLMGAIAVVAFSCVLLMLKKGKIILTGNLFVIAGFFKLIEFLPMNYSHQFYLQCFLGMMVCVAIYIKPYQLIATFSYTLLLNVYRWFYFNNAAETVVVSKDYVYEMSQACLAVFVFAFATFFYDRVIKNEIRINKKTKKLAETDQLTQLGNRQYFDQVLQHEINEMNTYELALLDIDFFKKVNDNYGHHKGDEVLVKFSKLLQNHFEETCCFRWGGEEFAVIFKGDMFVEKLHQFKDLIESTDFGLDNPLTVSIGCLQAEGISYDNVLKNTDEALYRAKKSGRNHIECYY